jgi:hypothetical protein
VNVIPRQPLPKDERGSALLAALCMAVVLTIALSSYLALCFTSLAMSTRSVLAARSQEIAEAGVEQAIYANNIVATTGATTGWNVSTVGGTTTMTATMTMTSSGLVTTSTNPTPLNFGNGATGEVNISMSFLAATPQSIQTITSQGVVTLPVGTIVSAATPRISRTVTFSPQTLAGFTTAAPLFVNAIAATSGKIKFSKAATIDSFNSNPSVAGLNKGAICVIAAKGTTTNAQWMAIGAPSNPVVGTSFTASGAGVGTGTVYENYNSSLINAIIPNYYINKGYSAIVASLDGSTATATVALKNAVIDGYVEGYDYSSPASTNWLSYVSGVAAVMGPAAPSATYVDTSRILTTPVPYQPVILEPSSLLTSFTFPYNYYNYTGQTTLGSSAANAPTYVYNAGSGFPQTSTSVTNIQGPVIIISYGNITLSGTAATGGMVQLTTSTASLQVFQEYGNVSIGGRGIQNTNTNPLPKKVALVGTNDSSGTVTFSTTSPFYGVIYFPYMPVTVSSNAVIYGSVVGSSVTFSGNTPALHYDLSLRNPDTSVGDAAFANLTAPVTVSNLVTSVP